MLAIEEMQAQQRAENGIREIVIGYIGHPEWEPEPPDIREFLGEFDASGAGPMQAVTVDQLPEDIRDILQAEMHRLETGETLTVEAFKEKKG